MRLLDQIWSTRRGKTGLDLLLFRLNTVTALTN